MRGKNQIARLRVDAQAANNVCIMAFSNVVGRLMARTRNFPATGIFDIFSVSDESKFIQWSATLSAQPTLRQEP